MKEEKVLREKKGEKISMIFQIQK